MSLKWRTAPCCCLSVFTFFPCSEHGVPANLQVWTSFSLGRVSSRFLQYCSLSMCAACWYLRLYYLDQHEAHSKAEREVHSSPQAPNTPQPPPWPTPHQWCAWTQSPELSGTFYGLPVHIFILSINSTLDFHCVVSSPPACSLVTFLVWSLLCSGRFS